MTGRTYTISDEVFASFPDYVRGVVVAYDLRNGSTPPELVEQLRAAEADLRGRMSPETITAHPRIASWRAAFKALGIKPNEFRCSVEAMARRAPPGPGAAGHQRPRGHREHPLPCAMWCPWAATPSMSVRGNLSLRPAKGTESFTPFGSRPGGAPGPGGDHLRRGRYGPGAPVELAAGQPYVDPPGDHRHRVQRGRPRAGDPRRRRGDLPRGGRHDPAPLRRHDALRGSSAGSPRPSPSNAEASVAEKPLRAPGRLALALLLLLVPRLRAEEGMWPFDRVPSDRIAARYGMAPGPGLAGSPAPFHGRLRERRDRLFRRAERPGAHQPACRPRLAPAALAPRARPGPERVHRP